MSPPEYLIRKIFVLQRVRYDPMTVFTYYDRGQLHLDPSQNSHAKDFYFQNA